MPGFPRVLRFSFWDLVHRGAAPTVDARPSPKSFPPIPQPAPRPVPREQAEVIRVADLLERWCLQQEASPDVHPRVLRDQRHAARHISELLGDLPLSHLDGDALRRYRDTRRSGHPPALPRAVQAELDVLRTAWSWGHGERCTPGPALPAVDLPMVVLGGHTPSPHDIADVLRTIHRSPREFPVWVHPAVQLLSSTGARVSEIASLTWDAVDLSRAELTTFGIMGRRRVRIEPEIVFALENWKGSQPSQLWPVAPATVTAGLQRTYLARACRLAGVPRFTCAAFRRAALVAVARAGVSV